MKKIILFGLVLGLCIVNTQWIKQAQATDVYAHTITLKSGWNVFSTPRLIQSHQFSVSETGSNFDIYLLNPSSVSGWSTMADLNQTEFIPLFGYFINNKTGSDQTLTLNYQQNVEPANRLFNRTMSSGWNIIGVANPTYALKQNDLNSTDTNNVSNILTSLSTCATTVLDFTDDQTEKNSVKVGDSWKQKVFSDANLINDFRETKAYAVYTTSSCSLSGSQDNSPITLTSTFGSLTISKKSDSPSGNVVLNATDVVLAKYEAVASDENIRVNTLLIDFTAPSATTKLRNGRIMVDGAQVGSTTNIDQTGTGTTYNINHTFIAGTTAVIEVRSDIAASAGTALADGDVLKVTLSTGVDNAQGVTSGNATLDVPNADVAANNLTVGVGSMTLTKDQAYGNQTAIVPTTASKLGSWTLTAGSNEAINLDTIQVDFTTADNFDNADLTNVYVTYGTKTSSTKATIANTGAHTSVGNAWSISEPLPANSNMTFNVYGNIASGAVVTEAQADTVIPALKVSGQTASGSAVTTGAATLAGQTTTAKLSGSLTVSLDNSTPLTAQAVAGSVSDGTLKIKLAATNEDLYVKSVTFRVDTNADDAALASVALFSAQGSGSFTQVSTTHTWNADGNTNPGYVTWSLTGTDRVLVAKNGNSYLLVKPTYVSSGQATVTNLTPRMILTDLKAEGASVLFASSATPNLVNDAGIIIQANGSSSFVDSGENDTAADTTSTATTLVIGGAVVWLPGDVLFIDENNDGAWNEGTEELMTVVADGGTDLTVTRGAYGTTAQAYTANAVNIYRLSTATMTTYASILGNAVRTVNDKLSLAIAADSPTGSTGGGNAMVVFKFTATAANNSADAAENKVVLTSVDLTTAKSGLTVNNVVVYPSTLDQNASYVTNCVALTASKWRCTMNTTGGTNEVVENTSRTYTVRADVGSGAGTNNSLTVSIASLGSANAAGTMTAGDVAWTDGTTPMTWVDQASSVVQPASAITMGANSGTTDATAPTIQALVFGGPAANTLTNTDTITITWSERIDPTTINASLIPGGSAVSVDGGTGDVAMATTGVVTITNIATTDVDSGVATATTYTPTASLSSNGTTLTITLSGASDTGALSGAEVFGDITGLTTTIKDVNGNTQADSAVNASGDI